MPRLYINYRLSLVIWLAILVPLIAVIIGLEVYASSTAPFVAVPTIFLLLLPMILLLRVPRSLSLQDRTIRAAGRGDNRRAPPVIAPPNAAEALAPGSSLQMTRTVSRGAILRVGSGNIVLAIIVSAISELLVALAFFAPLNGSNMDEPGWLVWFFVLVPLVMWFGFVAYQYVLLARQVVATITADDEGISLKQGLSRRQFIPWDDIHVWIRGGGNSSDAYLSSYGLIGYHHRLFLQFNSIFNLVTNRGKPLLAITYVGGIEAYQAQARQLLATIAARGKAPLRTFPQGFYGPGARQVSPFAQLTTTDIAVLPVAHPSLLPSWPAVQAMQMHPGPLTLNQRQKVSTTTYVLLGIIFALIGLIAVISILLSLLAGTDLSGVIINFLPVLLIIGIIFLRFRFIFSSTITVDAQGIRGWVYRRQIAVPWQKVRYWVIEPPSANHPREFIYGVFSDGPTLVWRVPVITGYDANSMAQRAYAESFHAMIAARTGQPPRQLPVQPPVA